MPAWRPLQLPEGQTMADALTTRAKIMNKQHRRAGASPGGVINKVIGKPSRSGSKPWKKVGFIFVCFNYNFCACTEQPLTILNRQGVIKNLLMTFIHTHAYVMNFTESFNACLKMHTHKEDGLREPLLHYWTPELQAIVEELFLVWNGHWSWVVETVLDWDVFWLRASNLWWWQTGPEHSQTATATAKSSASLNLSVFYLPSATWPPLQPRGPRASSLCPSGCASALFGLREMCGWQPLARRRHCTLHASH